jgi:hypothetical protein
MPTASFDFNLPEEQESYETTANAGKMWNAISEIRAELKAMKESIEFEKETKITKCKIELIEKIMDMIYEELSSEGIAGKF